MNEDSDRAELARVVAEWDRAMISNDADAIARFMADDWVIVGPDGSVTEKEPFLDLVRSGALTHDVMESHELDIRVHGDAAAVIARGVSGGTWREERFLLQERVTSMFIRRDAEWRCIAPHLSKLE